MATQTVPSKETNGAPPAVVLQAVPLAGAMEIPLVQIVPSKMNRRTVRNAEKDAEMVESIRMRGVQQTIIVRPREPGSDTGDGEMYKNIIGWAPKADVIYEIVAGERRWHLSHKAGKASIPAVVRKLSNAEALEIQNIENLQREDLDPLDRAEAIHDLYQQYLKAHSPKDAITRIASRLNCKERTLYNMMSLRNLLPDVQKAIRAGDISMSHGYELATLSPDPQKQVWSWLKQEMEYEPVSVRNLQDYIREEVFRRLSSATWNLDDANLLPAAGACTVCPKNTAVNPNLASGEKQATCTDPPCFEKKEKAHLVQIEAFVATERKEGSVLVSGDGRHVKDAIDRADWKESKEGSCPHTTRVIVASGSEMGKERHACIKRECKKHFGVPGRDDEGPSSSRRDSFPTRTLSAEEKRKRLQQTRAKKLDQEYRTAATAAIRKQVTDLKTADLQDVAAVLFERIDRRLKEPVMEAMGWKTSKRLYSWTPIKTPKEIAALKPADLAAFLALLTIADNVLPLPDYYGEHSPIDVEPFAKRHKIDLAKIKAQAEAPLRAKFKAIDERKKKAKPAQTSAKAKGKKLAAKKAA